MTSASAGPRRKKKKVRKPPKSPKRSTHPHEEGKAWAETCFRGFRVDCPGGIPLPLLSLQGDLSLIVLWCSLSDYGFRAPRSVTSILNVAVSTPVSGLPAGAQFSIGVLFCDLQALALRGLVEFSPTHLPFCWHFDIWEGLGRSVVSSAANQAAGDRRSGIPTSHTIPNCVRARVLVDWGMGSAGS